MRGQVSVDVRAHPGERRRTNPPSQRSPSRSRVPWRSSCMGLSAAVCVGIGLGLGLWVDSVLHTAPAFLLVGLALGLAVAALSVIKQIRTYL